MVLAEGIEIAELTKRILKICCRTCVVRTARFQLFWPLSSHRTSMHAPASRSNKCGVVRVHGVVPDKLTPTTRMANTHLWFSLSLSLSLSLCTHTHTKQVCHDISMPTGARLQGRAQDATATGEQHNLWNSYTLTRSFWLLIISF
jgi:hypothetical protein